MGVLEKFTIAGLIASPHAMELGEEPARCLVFTMSRFVSNETGLEFPIGTNLRAKDADSSDPAIAFEALSKMLCSRRILASCEVGSG